MYSDLSSALSMAAFSFIHSQKGVLKNAAFSLVSSIAGRMVSHYMSGGSIDTATANKITPQMKDSIAVGVARAAIAMVAKEPNFLIKSYDTIICDLVGAQLIVSVGMEDKSVFTK